MKKVVSSVFTLTMVLGLYQTALANNPTDAEEIKLLKERIAKLEAKISANEKATTKVSTDLKKKNENDWKINGDIRVRAVNDSNSWDSSSSLRLRLRLEKQINKYIRVYTRWNVIDENTLGETGSKDQNNKIHEAFMDIKLAKDQYTRLGRFGHSIGATQFWGSAGSLGMFDGVQYMGRFGKLRTELAYGTWAAAGSTSTNANTKSIGTMNNSVITKLRYTPKKNTDIYLWWVKEVKHTTPGAKIAADSFYDIRGIGVKTPVAKDLNFALDIGRNYAMGSSGVAGAKPFAYWAQLSYKDADYDVAHSWEARAYYRRVQNGYMYNGANTAQNVGQNKFFGPGVSLHYVPVKNLMAELFFSFANKDATDTSKDIPNYVRFQLSTRF